MANLRKSIIYTVIWVLFSLLTACNPNSPVPGQTGDTPPAAATKLDRTAKIPANATKMDPATDAQPPVVYASDYEQPVPVPGAVNTAGAEDSPFITPDGNTLYFFFTPDVNVPLEQQLTDGVTGIYVSHKTDGVWGEAQRVLLQEAGKLSLDGCEFVQAEVMWFCSTRQGYTGLHWFRAQFINGSWQDWKLADFDPAYQVGELHFSADGKQVYFGSERPGGKGGMDIWRSSLVNGSWQAPVNIRAVNTADSEGWPALNPGEDELWFYRNYSIWRSKLENGEWQAPEIVVSPLAGEPSLDAAGNLYFVHHYYREGKMIEADIYVAEKR